MLYMEDVNEEVTKLTDDITNFFKDKKITISDEQSDAIWEVLMYEIEHLANYPDYRNYN